MKTVEIIAQFKKIDVEKILREHEIELPARKIAELAEEFAGWNSAVDSLTEFYKLIKK